MGANNVADTITNTSGDHCQVDEQLLDDLAIIVQNLQMLEQRLSPELSANQEAAKELGISLEQLDQYLLRRDVYDFTGGIRRASKRMMASIRYANSRT